MKTYEEYVLQELIEIKNVVFEQIEEIKKLESENKDLEFQLKNYEKIVERTIDYVNKFDGEQRDYILDLLTGDIL